MDNYFNEIDIEKYSADIEKCGQVFVYGTLKTGGEIRGLNNLGLNVEPKGKAKTSYPDYEMLDLGAFPGLLKGKSFIVGEVWTVDADALFTLDGIEGFDRDGSVGIKIGVTGRRAGETVEILATENPNEVLKKIQYALTGDATYLLPVKK